MSNDRKSNDETDFFAKDVPLTPAAAKAPASDSTVTEPAPRATGWRAAIKPTLVLCAALVLGAVWAFGKPILSGSPGQGTPPSGVDAAASRYFAEPDSTPPSTRPGKNRDEATPRTADPAVTSASSPVNRAPIATPSTLSLSQIEALDRQLWSPPAELTAADATPPLSQAAASAASSATAAANTVKLAKPRVSRRPPPRDGTDEPVVLSTYRINTIYNGQAWIEGGQRTYVVEPGMSIDGMRIDRIDASSRRVITSQGEIR